MHCNIGVVNNLMYIIMLPCIQGVVHDSDLTSEKYKL